jgi:hypothetical protein
MDNQNQINQEDEKRTIDFLVKEILSLKQQVVDLKNDKIRDELKLPENVLEENNILEEKPKRLRVGAYGRPLLESEILEAQENSDTAMGASRYLGVNILTYKKYAKKYGIFKAAKVGGRHGGQIRPDKGKCSIQKILNGEFPNHPIFRIKDKLIRSGIKKPNCENCGFGEKRITDGKIPLLIDFLDDNSKNHKLENMRILCYNCMFNVGRGHLRRGPGRVYFDKQFYDCDRIQGAISKVKPRF